MRRTTNVIDKDAERYRKEAERWAKEAERAAKEAERWAKELTERHTNAIDHFDKKANQFARELEHLLPDSDTLDRTADGGILESFRQRISPEIQLPPAPQFEDQIPFDSLKQSFRLYLDQLRDDLRQQDLQSHIQDTTVGRLLDPRMLDAHKAAYQQALSAFEIANSTLEQLRRSLEELQLHLKKLHRNNDQRIRRDRR